jgi:hypothetical protein
MDDSSIFEDLGITGDEDAPKSADLSAITKEAVEMRRIKTALSKAEDVVKSLQRDMQMAEERVRILMDAAGMLNFTLSDGKVVAIETTLHASLPKEKSRREAILNKVREYGNDKIIKNELVVTLTQGGDNMAKALEAQAKEMGLEVDRTENIHASTYKKFVNDRIKSGKEIDLAFFSAYQETKAIIKE